MKTKFFSLPMLMILFSIGFLVSFTKKTADVQKDEKYFTLRLGDNPMSNEIKTQLITAYKAQYGPKAIVKEVTLEDFKGETWLVFTSGNKDNPTVAYQTRKKTKPASTTLPDNGPKEHCHGSGCSVCKFALGGGCYCDNRGGGGECNHSISRISDDVSFVNSLFN